LPSATRRWLWTFWENTSASPASLLFSQHHGQVINPLGDGFFVEFASALEAVCCAIATQRALTERNETVPPVRVIQIRIGIHLGMGLEK
jgi:class 3 adenylate cyclase